MLIYSVVPYQSLYHKEPFLYFVSLFVMPKSGTKYKNLILVLFNNLALTFITKTAGIKHAESHLLHTEFSNDMVYFTGCQ